MAFASAPGLGGVIHPAPIRSQQLHGLQTNVAARGSALGRIRTCVVSEARIGVDAQSSRRVALDLQVRSVFGDLLRIPHVAGCHC